MLIRIFPLLVALVFSLSGFVLYGYSPQPHDPEPTDRPFRDIAQPTATPDSPEARLSAGTLPRHRVVADLNYTARRVDVEQRTLYVNDTEHDLEEIVFFVEPNRWREVFYMGPVILDGEELLFSLDSTRLTVELPEPLAPDCEIELLVVFRLEVGRIGANVHPSKGYFGYTERQMNLAHWLPALAPTQNASWITHRPILIGEQQVLNKADWEVTLNLVNPPPGLTIAAPGIVTPVSDTMIRYTHHNSRDFSLSLSNHFQVSTTQTDEGVTVELYTLPDAVAGAPEHALEAGARSLSMYADLFGDYLYDRLVIVQGDFPDGMEHSGLVFVGTNWFSNWSGRANSFLTLITVHEVSHQWWYARVGNDPALTPWLDEALSTYMEYIYLEEYHPELRDWWWQFRVDRFTPDGHVDSTIYEFNDTREYINAVYLRGVKMLHDLRADLGTEAFFRLLADYAEVGTGQIATSELFWSLLTPEQLEQTAATRQRYLRQPRVLDGLNQP
jgi:hypothetical protein